MDLAGFFTPEGVSPLAAAIIVAASFLSAGLTAALGLGGGLILLALMSATFPPAAVIPVHGVAQLGANVSRFYFLRSYVIWPIIGWFSLGAVIGAGLGGQIAISLPEQALRLGVGLFILATTWAPLPKSFAPGPRSFFSIGAAATFLTMFFGATGPVAAAMLANAKLERMHTVATHAAVMVAQHGLKSLVFGFLGFAFADWLGLILAILIAGFLGSYAGARVLVKMPETSFKFGFKALISAVALYLIFLAVSGWVSK